MVEGPSNFQETLSSPRATLLRGLSVGVWSQGAVHVNRKKGSGWKGLGRTHHGNTVLTSEEALFMMECGSLEVTVNGLPSTLQQAYHSFLPAHTLPTYQVYAALRRVGQRVNLKRSSAPDSLPANKSMLEVTQSLTSPLQLHQVTLGDEVLGPSLPGPVGACLCEADSQAYYLLTPFIIENCTMG